MSKFTDLMKANANRKLTKRIILEGKEKLYSEDIIEITLTITDFEIVDFKGDKFAVIIFKERPDNFYFGGLVITNLLDDIKGDLLDDFKKEGLRVKFHKDFSSNKRVFYNVTII